MYAQEQISEKDSSTVTEQMLTQRLELALANHQAIAAVPNFCLSLLLVESLSSRVLQNDILTASFWSRKQQAMATNIRGPHKRKKCMSAEALLTVDRNLDFQRCTL